MKQNTPVKNPKEEHGRNDPVDRARKVELVWVGENLSEWQVSVGPVVYKPKKPKKGSGKAILCEMLSLIIEAATDQSLQAQQDGDAEAEAEAQSFIDQAVIDRQHFGCR
ncbi:hypothetical protein AB0K11_17835 [Mycobacterium sp. NPDC050551]|uniref:hypothetical protein n=1 Tax=Mycobacterium sp. NPDC050551 TaxID=3155407 RepID=UPI00343DEE18